MIGGSKEVRIRVYSLINGNSIEPQEDEELWGIPAGYIAIDSQPFIEHRKNGVVTRSVNCVEVSNIYFMT